MLNWYSLIIKNDTKGNNKDEPKNNNVIINLFITLTHLTIFL